MKKQIVLLGIVTILLLVGISGCVGSSNRFIGTWEFDTDDMYGNYTFWKDYIGKVVVYHKNSSSHTDIVDFIYEIVDDNTLKIIGNGITDTLTYSFKSDNEFHLLVADVYVVLNKIER